jgi:hypothetical protein
MNLVRDYGIKILLATSLVFIGNICTAQTVQDATSLTLGSEISGSLSPGDWDYYQINGPFDLAVQYDNGGLYTLASDPHLRVSQDDLPTISTELP